MTNNLGPIHVPGPDDKELPPAAPERTQTLFLWAAATAVGLFVYNVYFQLLLAARLTAALAAGSPNASSLALALVLIPAGVSQGVLVGGAQWYLLRRYVKNFEWWVAASVLGWAVFYCLDLSYLALGQHFSFVAQLISSQDGAGGIIFFSVFSGLTSGLFQWLVLRRWGAATTLWIPVVILAQIVGILVPQLLQALPIAAVMGWIGSGLVLGLGMAYLLNVCWPKILGDGLAVPVG